MTEEGGASRRSLLGGAGVTEEGGASRRALLGGAGVMAGAIAFAGCGRQAKSGRQSVKKAPMPVRRVDVEILNGALQLERRTVAAYTAGIPLLTKPHAKAAKQFLNEELQHTGELLSLIKAAGGEATPRSASYDLGHPEGDAAVLALLHALERAQIALYLDAIPRLSPGPVRAAVATILTSDAQHIAILRMAQGLRAAPSAFVTGSE